MTFVELKNRIESFKKLKAGWDSYNAKPIDKQCIKRAFQINKMFLEFEDDIINAVVSPVSDGGILFEFELDDTEVIMIEILKEKECLLSSDF